MGEHFPEYINNDDIFDQDNLDSISNTHHFFEDFLNNNVNLDMNTNVHIHTNHLRTNNINFQLTPEDVILYQYGRALENIYLEKSERQFIRDVLIDKDNKAWIAFCMGQHPRLGVDSPLKVLPNDVYSIIRKFHHKDIESMIDDETIDNILIIMEQENCSVNTAVESYLDNDRDLINTIMSFQ